MLAVGTEGDRTNIQSRVQPSDAISSQPDTDHMFEFVKQIKMASSFVSKSAPCVLFVDKVQVATIKNRVPVSLKIPSAAVPLSPSCHH
jgi:hypothetical protein